MTTVLTDEQREMVLANVPLVEHIVNRIAANLPSSHSRDDLVQTGIMGLITATVRFDPDNGTSFSTFAGRRIEGAVIDMLRQADWAPRSVRALERRLTTAEDRRAAPTPESTVQLSRELGIDAEQLHRLRHDIQRARLDSLDRSVSTEGGVPTPLSSTVSNETNEVEDALDDQELVGYLRHGVSLLPERHRAVIVGYFFEGISMTDLGNLLGVTQSRASQIKDEALKMLRIGLREAYSDDGADPSGETPTRRQRVFSDSLGSGQPWRDRLAAGKGISVAG